MKLVTSPHEPEFFSNECEALQILTEKIFDPPKFGKNGDQQQGRELGTLRPRDTRDC